MNKSTGILILALVFAGGMTVPAVTPLLTQNKEPDAGKQFELLVNRVKSLDKQIMQLNKRIERLEAIVKGNGDDDKDDKFGFKIVPLREEGKDKKPQ